MDDDDDDERLVSFVVVENYSSNIVFFFGWLCESNEGLLLLWYLELGPQDGS